MVYNQWIAMKKPDLELLEETVTLLRRPLVYVLVDNAGRAVYVGAAKHGICRPLGRDHHAISETNGSIQIYSCESFAEALRLEKELIESLSPTRNIRPGIDGQTPNRIETGISRTARGLRAFVRTGGTLRSKSFPLETPIDTVRSWRASVREPGTARRARHVAAMNAAGHNHG
jgi:hypothetical protein